MSVLTDAAAAGDPDAWAEIFATHRRQINNYLYARTKSSLLAEDLTQDVFVRAMRSIGTFTDRGPGIVPWLMTIARNLLLDHVGRKSTRMEISVDEWLDDPDRAAPSAEAVVLRADESALIVAALQKLPVEARQLIVLMYWEELSMRAIGQRTYRSEGAVKSALYRARAALQKSLLEAAA